MSSLSSLHSRLSNLNSQKSILEDKLRIQRKRKDEIVSIINNMNDVSDDNYEDVNKYLKKTTDALDDGIKGNSNIRSIISDMPADKEKYAGGDTNIGLALDNLKTELSQTESRITVLSNDLTSVRSQIISTEHAIAEERRRLAEKAKSDNERK